MTKVELTGKCKRKTITTDGDVKVYEYVEVYRKIFGFKFGTRWAHKGDIVIRDEKEEIYNCDEN